MKLLLSLFFSFFVSVCLYAQYPFTNYWFVELGGATPLSQHHQTIYKAFTQGPVEWSPASWALLNVGLHLETEKGSFLEPFFHLRGLDESTSSLIGLRWGRGKGRARWFIEGEYGGEDGSFFSYSSNTESAGVSYGMGFRYRLTTRMSAQVSLLRNHFSQFEKVEPPYKHPVRTFAVASLYWNLNIKSDKTRRSPKIKKLSPRQQNRCLY